MSIYKVIKQCPFQPCAKPGIHPEAAPGELYAASIVNKTKLGAELHVVFWLKIKFVWLSEISERLIIFLAPCNHVIIGRIWQSEHKVFKLVFYGSQFCLNSANPLFKRI
jgi:hypothetical protein